MINNSKISIIITTFNKEQFIKKTIKSCLNQTYNNFEIIIVDTGSTDFTKNIVNIFKSKKIKKIFLNRKFNSSPLNQIYAIRKALQSSEGELICLLDGDDFFHSNKLNEINNIFNKDRKICFVQDIIKIRKENKLINFDVNRKPLFFEVWPKFYPTSSMSVRKNYLKNFFKFDKMSYDLLEIDFRLYFYSLYKSKNSFFLNRVLTYYSVDNFGISSKFVKFSRTWFKKRFQAHDYLKNIILNKSYPYKIDFFLTSLIMRILSIF